MCTIMCNTNVFMIIYEIKSWNFNEKHIICIYLITIWLINKIVLYFLFFQKIISIYLRLKYKINVWNGYDTSV